MTDALPLERETILKRISGIQGEITEMRTLGKLSLQDFATTVAFKLAQFHLHRALEGVFHIGGHLLSRFSGSQATTYAEIARQLGERGIVEKEFAEHVLVKMAKYRNRLVHFYAEITEVELHGILQKNLDDIEIFLGSVKKILEHPEQFGLTIDAS